MSGIDFKKVRADFPALTQRVRGKNLVYLDSAATTLKPWPVIERISHFNTYETANVHRGAHFLADQATVNFEATRETVKEFINADSAEEIIFTKGTTESVNLVAGSWARKNLKAGDEILLTQMEHHANIVPWQVLEKELGILIKWIPVTESGELDQQQAQKLFSNKTKLLSMVHVSNSLGTVNDVRVFVKMAKAVGAKVFVDGAQAVANMKVDMKSLDVDFYAFSGHKLFGPYGIGVLYGKKEILQDMPPYQTGGSMISKVSFSGTTFNELPHKFEAGTPNIEAAISMKPAIDYVSKIGLEHIQSYEHSLSEYAQRILTGFPGLKIYGQSKQRAPIFSFNIEGLHASDMGNILDQEGIAVRVGHLCTQPLLERFGATAVVRASLSIYNSTTDVDRLLEGLTKAKEMLA